MILYFRGRIADEGRAPAFAPRSGSATPWPERSRQSKALASSQASAAFANALLAAISSLALEQLRARANTFNRKVALEARWRIKNRAIDRPSRRAP
jgi:hypothetical protein